MTENDCVFCQIARKEARASVIYEDEKVMAFMDIRPVSEGHSLVIPKQHYADIFDIPDELLAAVHIVTKKIAAATKTATNTDGISIVQQNGKAAGQDIFHFHVHVISRFEGVKVPQFEQLDFVERKTLDDVAQKIKQNLA